MKKLWNQNKVGTLIISCYRSGTHFLQDAIAEHCPFPTEIIGEICTGNSIQQLIDLTNSNAPYKLCILNNSAPKFYLTTAEKLLSNWHVIDLTRHNKVNHFISHWFWFQNTLEQQQNDTGKFRHHNTDHSVYCQYLNEIKKTVSLDFVIVWLQEQLINRFVKSDVSIDYTELIEYQSDTIRWLPNSYENIQLSDIIINHKEITDLLLNFNIAGHN